MGLNTRWNFAVGNKVITPINKDFFIELWETTNQYQIEKDLNENKFFYRNTCLYDIMVQFTSHDVTVITF